MRILPLVITIAVAAACASERDDGERGPIHYRHAVPKGDPVAAFGRDHLDALAGATAAHATRIDGDYDPKADGYRFRALGEPVPLDPHELQTLQEIFASGRISAQQKMCIPTPGVRIVVSGAGGATSEVLICFECGMIRLGAPTTDFAPREWLDFPLAKPNLVALARRIFPEDPAFQTIQWY
jgi:hypothetical protein